MPEILILIQNPPDINNRINLIELDCAKLEIKTCKRPYKTIAMLFFPSNNHIKIVIFYVASSPLLPIKLRRKVQIRFEK